MMLDVCSKNPWDVCLGFQYVLIPYLRELAIQYQPRAYKAAKPLRLSCIMKCFINLWRVSYVVCNKVTPNKSSHIPKFVLKKKKSCFLKLLFTFIIKYCNLLAFIEHFICCFLHLTITSYVKKTTCLTCWILLGGALSILGLWDSMGSMGNACHSKIKSSSTG